MPNELSNRKARAFFEDLWKQGDPWKLESSAFERARYGRQILILSARRYPRALEIGCGAGAFSRLLTPLVDGLIALDISATAIARAHHMGNPDKRVEFRVANIMEYDLQAEGPWDLIIMSETIYYLGWLYSFFDVAWLAREVFAATRAGGQLLLANTCNGVEDYLLRSWIVRTYHDLFLNVGYRRETEEIFTGVKDGTEIEVLISLLGKHNPGTG